MAKPRTFAKGIHTDAPGVDAGGEGSCPASKVVSSADDSSGRRFRTGRRLQSAPVQQQSVPPESGHRPSSSLAKRAVLGAIWTITTSIGSRVVGLVGTLLITRFLSPDICGEFSLAAVIVMTANMLSNCGLSQYIVAKPNEGREASFHATFYFLLLGIAALGVTVVFQRPIADFMHAPGVIMYIPGLSIAMLFERIATVQDRILVRDMRFQSVGLQRSLGEVVFAVVSVGMAWAGWGGASFIWASIARSFLRFVTLSFTTPRREWLEPCRITWQRTRDLFAFGLPMSVATIAGFGSRRWDNILIGRHFGQGILGIYNLAYNLADIPATQIGETLGDVLVPSFAQMDSQTRRKKALMLSMRILMLIVAPLAIGLGAIAPTLVKTLFDQRWAQVADMLIVLSVLSIVRPVGWIGSSYLQVKNRPREIMVLEVSKTVGLLALIALFQNLHRILDSFGLHPIVEALNLEHRAPLWACAAVGIAFALNSLGFMWEIKRVDGLTLREQILPLLPPIIACVPMVLAVLGIRHALADRATPMMLKLVAETAVGALVFIPSALLLAPSISKELLKLLRHALQRRRAGSTMRPIPPEDLAGPAIDPVALAAPRMPTLDGIPSKRSSPGGTPKSS